MRRVSLIAAMTLLVSPPLVPAQESSSHRDVFDEFLEAVNSRSLTRLDDLLIDDFVRHSQATPGVDIDSREDFKAFLESDFAAVPDSRIECPFIVAEGDMLATWCAYSGTQKGPWGPFPASNRRVDLDFASFFRFEDERIAEVWVTWDNLAALTQLGHIEQPERPEP